MGQGEVMQSLKEGEKTAKQMSEEFGTSRTCTNTSIRKLVVQKAIGFRYDYDIDCNGKKYDTIKYFLLDDESN